MDSEWLLPLLSFGMALLGWTLWMRAMRNVSIPEDRRGYVAWMLVAVALGAAAIGVGVGGWGIVLAGVGLFAGAVFLILVGISRQKGGSGSFQLGEVLPDFEALTEAGEPFRLSKQLEAGHPVLLKFFRGHW